MQRGIWCTRHSETWPRSTDKFQLFSTLLGIRMPLFPAHRREAGTEEGQHSGAVSPSGNSVMSDI